MAIYHNPQNGVLVEMMGCWEKFCSQPPEEQAPSLVLLQLRDKWETHSPNIHLIFIHVWTWYTFKFFLYTKHTILPTLLLFRRSRSYTRVNNHKQICRSDLLRVLWKGQPESWHSCTSNIPAHNYFLLLWKCPQTTFTKAPPAIRCKPPIWTSCFLFVVTNMPRNTGQR